MTVVVGPQRLLTPRFESHSRQIVRGVKKVWFAEGRGGGCFLRSLRFPPLFRNWLPLYKNLRGKTSFLHSTNSMFVYINPWLMKHNDLPCWLSTYLPAETSWKNCQTLIDNLLIYISNIYIYIYIKS